MFRTFVRGTVSLTRNAEALAVFFGGIPRKIDRFNRLIEPDIAASLQCIARAEVIVGIPFYKEVETLPAVVHKAQRDLELRPEPSAIVIVGERKTKALLDSIKLPPSTERVKIVRFSKPFGFGQKPGLSRRSWTHWAIFQLAHRLGSDVAFIDADVRNTEGWVDRYVESIRQGADIAVANYIRSFGSDDAMVHLWDRLIFGALFGRWIEFRQGGDYAVSRRIIPSILNDPSILREVSYTLDSAVMAHVAALAGRIEFVWLGRKQHEPIAPERLFKRLPDLVQSVFDDVEAHLPAVLDPPNLRGAALSAATDLKENPAMTDLVGDRFLRELHADFLWRAQGQLPLLRRILGKSLFRACIQTPSAAAPSAVHLSANNWARATFRFLTRYLWKNMPPKDRRALAQAYVPVLEVGALGFLNHTADIRYRQAMDLIEAEYLPAFGKAWRALARRRIFQRASFWRKWPSRLRLGVALRSFKALPR